MRFLTILAIVATALWGAYWFAGSRALDRAVVSGLAASPEISAAGHSIQGFPNRFDVTFDQPRVALRGATWTAPFVQFFALSYQPNHLVTVFANDQTLEVGGETITIHSDDLRASMVMSAALDLPLDRVTLIGQQLEIGALDMTHRADGLRAASRLLDGARHEVALVLERVFPDTTALDRLDPARAWPRVLEGLRMEGVVEFDRPLNRRALQGRAPRIDDLHLSRAQVTWEGVDIDATGELRLDARRQPVGQLTVQITGWETVLTALRETGVIPQDQMGFIMLALQGLRSPDDPNRIEAPLIFENGAVRLGPLTLGRIPPLG